MAVYSQRVWLLWRCPSVIWRRGVAYLYGLSGRALWLSSPSIHSFLSTFLTCILASHSLLANMVSFRRSTAPSTGNNTPSSRVSCLLLLRASRSLTHLNRTPSDPASDYVSGHYPAPTKSPLPRIHQSLPPQQSLGSHTCLVTPPPTSPGMRTQILLAFDSGIASPSCQFTRRMIRRCVHIT